ncbi:MAG TPA: hypothetical protein VFK13_08750 [Gemmatimonadaceae bacterium]|nr:hypothetical protein [Gemmatimonadaceae bacterium]
MIIGVTGTRRGISIAQLRAYTMLLDQNRPAEVHHGDAVGADAELHRAARALGFRIVVHPPLGKKHRAFCEGDVVHRPKSREARDRDVVDASDLLFAAPAEPGVEGPNTGTWYTVQYALWRGTPIVLVWPDGTREVDRGAAARG